MRTIAEHAPQEEGQRPLRMLALVAKGWGISPAQRFRLEQWAPYLAREHGIILDFRPFESPQLTKILYGKGHVAEKVWWTSFDFLRRAKMVALARRYDGVVISREAALIGPAIYERLLALTGAPMVFDFDDTIWLSQPGASANGFFSRLRFPGKAAAACRLATAVTPGNQYLATYASRFNNRVFVVPTSIELNTYQVQPELQFNDPFVVCWTGSTTTLAHFECAREALEQLARERRIIVKVICNIPPSRPIAGAETQFVEWRQEREVAEIGAAHVGIMPLPDDDISRGKCGLKALQYMATGRPAIVAPVGMNRDLITHRVNGLFASSTEALVSALRELADDPNRRREMGLRARETVQQHFSARSVASRFAAVIREACPTSP